MIPKISDIAYIFINLNFFFKSPEDGYITQLLIGGNEEFVIVYSVIYLWKPDVMSKVI